MATTSYQNQGSSVTWAASGGTYLLTLTSLATNTGRKGAAHDFGVNFPHIVRVDLLTRFGTAPTAGKQLMCGGHPV